MDKSVLITGANRGLGFALVEIFVNNGYIVYALIRSEDSRQALEKVGARVLIGDVSTNEVITSIETAHIQSLDIIINNAGVAGSGEQTLDYSPDVLSKTLETNVVGSFRVIKALASRLKQDGLIINVSSRFGSFQFTKENTHRHCTSHYKISKAALNMLTLSLHLEYKDKFKTVAIHPGEIMTSMKSGDAQLSPEKAAANIFDCLDIFESGRLYSTTTKQEMNW